MTRSPALYVRSMHGAGADILELGPHERPALAGLDVLKIDHLEQLAVYIEDQPVPEVGGSGHEIEESQSGLQQFEQLRPAVGKPDRPIRSEVDIVLQPDSTPARKIDTRLHRHHRARR